MQSWNFGIQRKLPGNTVVEVAYSASHGVHLMGIQEWDQLDPKYLSAGAQLNSQVPNPFFGIIAQGTVIDTENHHTWTIPAPISAVARRVHPKCELRKLHLSRDARAIRASDVEGPELDGRVYRRQRDR